MGNEVVHQFNTLSQGCLGLISIAVFLYLIDYAARMLRPVSIVHRVGMSGSRIERLSVGVNNTPVRRRVFRQFRSPGPNRSQRGHLGDRARRGLGGIGHASATRQRDDSIRPQVGDFVAADEPLFRCMAAPVPSTTVSCGGSRTRIERTLEQDPTFAFRILVDIAIKALSRHQ